MGVHKNFIVGHPFCQMDKWEDNHYAIDNWDFSASSIVPYVDKNNVPHTCSTLNPSQTLKIHYIFDPTGWGIQADFGFTTSPKDCQVATGSAARHLQGGTFNPACDPGTCAANLSPSQSLIV